VQLYCVYQRQNCKAKVDLKQSADTILRFDPKFLGAIFDKTLNFNMHFENLRVRALKRLNIIFSASSWGLSTKTLKSIYTALVGSISDYSFFTLANVSKTTLQKLQVIQNSALRRIHHLPMRTRVTVILEVGQMRSIRGANDFTGMPIHSQSHSD